MAVRDRAVLEADHLRVGAGEVYRERVVLDVNRQPDCVMSGREAVVIGVFFTEVATIRKRRYDLAERFIRVIEYRFEIAYEMIRAELVGKRLDAFGADTPRREGGDAPPPISD